MSTLILPCAGSAERMGGIPKFLLPTGNQKENLLKYWIESGLNFASKILIPTNSIFYPMVNAMYASENVKVLEVDTKSMPETISTILPDGDCIVGMPDTYISNLNAMFERIKWSEPSEAVCNVGIWKIQDFQKGKVGQVALSDNNEIVDIIDKDPFCDLEFFWGALAWKESFSKFIQPEDKHLGISLKRAISSETRIKGCRMESKYFDCGTPQEYLKLLIANSTT